jgi:plastocyanin
MLRNMRSLLLAVLAAVTIPAYTDDITGGKGTGGNPGSDTGGDTCTCPDGTIMDGNVCATACPAPESGAGTIAIVTDAPTYNTQLMSTVTVNVTVTGSQGFSGLVALTAAIKDGTETPITEWTTAFDNAMVSVPMNGTATAKLTITIPSVAVPSTDMTKMSETLTITGTPQTAMVTAQTATAAVVAANTLEIDMSANANNCTFPAYVTSAALQVAVGTTINWKNTGTVSYQIHVDTATSTGANNDSGIQHQGEGTALAPSPTTAAGTTDDVWPEVVAKVVTGNVTWHCHAPAGSAPADPVGFAIVLPQ